MAKPIHVNKIRRVIPVDNPKYDYRLRVKPSQLIGHSVGKIITARDPANWNRQVKYKIKKMAPGPNGKFYDIFANKHEPGKKNQKNNHSPIFLLSAHLPSFY